MTWTIINGIKNSFAGGVSVGIPNFQSIFITNYTVYRMDVLSYQYSLKIYRLMIFKPLISAFYYQSEGPIGFIVKCVYFLSSLYVILHHEHPKNIITFRKQLHFYVKYFVPPVLYLKALLLNPKQKFNSRKTPWKWLSFEICKI